MGEGTANDSSFHGNGKDVEKELRRKNSQLEATIARLTIERDDLARDIESFCLDDSSNTTFNVSSVLNERIFVAGGFNKLTLLLSWTAISACDG